MWGYDGFCCGLGWWWVFPAVMILIMEALAKPPRNEGLHGSVKLYGEVFLTEFIVASVFVSFAQIRPCFGHAYRVDQLAWHECCGGSGCQF
jgi:hypothetical protein